MRAEDLIEALSERPFVPVRLHLDDGRTREIHHPEMAIVSRTLVAIGLASNVAPGLAERITHCAVDHIVEIEPLVSPPQ